MPAKHERSETPIPIDYAVPVPRERRPITSIRLTLLLATIGTMQIGIAAGAMPKIEAVFVDFKAPLPATIAAYLSITRILRNPAGWVLIAIIAVGVPILVTQLSHLNCTPDQGRRRQRILGGFVSVVATLSFVATIIILLMSWAAMMDGLSKP